MSIFCFFALPCSLLKPDSTTVLAVLVTSCKIIGSAPSLARNSYEMHVDSIEVASQAEALETGKRLLDECEGMRAKIEQLHGRFRLLDDAEVSCLASLLTRSWLSNCNVSKSPAALCCGGILYGDPLRICAAACRFPWEGQRLPIWTFFSILGKHT